MSKRTWSRKRNRYITEELRTIYPDYVQTRQCGCVCAQQRKNLRASKSDRLIPLLTVLFELGKKENQAQTQHQLVKKPLDGQTHYFVWSDGRSFCRHFDQTHQGREKKQKSLFWTWPTNLFMFSFWVARVANFMLLWSFRVELILSVIAFDKKRFVFNET